MSREAREKAKATGQLPHEILLSMCRGEPQLQWQLQKNEAGAVIVDADGTPLMTKQYVVLDIEARRAAAIAAAPYFAPKLSAVETIQAMSEEELDEIIRSNAAEAGVSLGVDGEGPAGEAEDDEGGSQAPAPRARRRISQA